MEDKLKLLLEVVIFLGGIITVYVNLSNKISELEIRMRVAEKQDDKILTKLDDISEAITDLKVSVSNKQDRIK